MIRAVSNFSVLAGGRIWSGFFSYKTSPLCALMTMTELAPVAGTTPGTVGISVGSALSRGFTVARGVRLDFDRCGTAVGLTTSASSSLDGVAATQQSASVAAQKTVNGSKRRFMSGKLAAKIYKVQADARPECL